MTEPLDNENLPNINKPETILGVVIAFVILSALAICLRLYVRIRARFLGWDDLFVVLAGVAVITGSSLTCLMPDFGMGKHFATLTHAQVVQYFKHIWSTNITYVASTTFIKLAILFQYLRLFEISNSRLARNLTFVLLVLTSLWGATFFLLALFSCRPIQKNWNFLLEGTCVAWGSKKGDVFFASWAAHAATNMLFDILVFLLPIPFLRSLRMRGGKTRAGLVALFVMGSLVVSLSISRLVSLCIKRAGTIPVFDPSYATPSIYLFSVLEVNIAIITASIPIFWPLVTKLAPNKILVVNEIEIRTDRMDSQTRFAEQGAAVSGQRHGDAVGVGVPGFEKETSIDGGRCSRMSVSAYHDDDRKRGLARTASTTFRLSRSLSRSRGQKHQHQNHRSKPSTASSNKSIPIELNYRRTSDESTQGFNLAHQASNGTLSLSGSSSPEIPVELSRMGTREYAERYTPMGDREEVPFQFVSGGRAAKR